MAAGDIFQQSLVTLVSAEPVANVFYMEVLDDTGTTDAEDDAKDALINHVKPDLIAFQSSGVAYECVLSRKVFPTTGPARVFTVAGTGSLGGGLFPANVAVNMRHYSDNGDRNKRGRWYFPGLLKSWVSDGRIADDHAAVFQTLIDTVTATITDSGRTYRLKHYSKKLNLYYDIDSCQLNPIPV
ncbi:MAG: hypothetical protein ACYTGS_15775, partial [Planctomycetota bacterium]